MPWAYASLRNQRVLAKIRASDGAFEVDEDGRVEIRYKPTDTRAYQASARNLERLAGPTIADADVVAGELVAPSKTKEERSTASPSIPQVGDRLRRSTERKATAAAKALAPGAVPKNAYTVYVDGACSGNPGPAGLGIVIVSPDGKHTEGREYLGNATNNVAELTAILRAAELVPHGEPAVVHTDSQYSIGVLTKNWKAKANQELVANVKHALSTRRGWKLVYVPGHSGVPLNERADKLAVEAVSTRASRMPCATIKTPGSVEKLGGS